MATWNQGISSGGFLAGIGSQNSNAPQASDANTALAYIRKNNEDNRSGRNNIGLQALQGIGSVMDIYKKQEQAKRQQDFQSAYGQAYASGDRNAMRQLASQFPDQVEAVRNGMKFVDDDQRATVGNLAASARLAASSPETMGAWLQNNAADLQRVGLDPAEVAQTYQQNPQQFGEFVDHLGMAALGPVDYFNAQDKMIGRQQEQQRINETARNNDLTNARGIRGQNLQYQSSMTGHGIAAERLVLDKQKFAAEQEQALQKAQALITEAPKLSVNMEKSIEKSTGDAAASRNAASSMSTLANTLETQKPRAGLFGNVENTYAQLTGQDNYLRDARIRFNQLANAQATKFLPPGPASDKDIEFARKGIPSDTDNPVVMARWLKGMAKLEENNANFNDFKSEWMSANGNPGQSNSDRNILGMDVKKGESMSSAAKRYLASQMPSGNSQQAPQASTHTSKSGITFKVE